MTEEKPADRFRPLEEEEKELLRVKTRIAEAEASVAEDEATAARIVLAKIVEAEQFRLAGNPFRRIYCFDELVAEASVKKAIVQTDLWSVVDPGCEMTIRIFSPGGDVIAGMYLFDHLMGLRRKGHVIRTEAFGYAASMGGILLQAGNHRVVGKESYILIHEIQTAVRGKIGEIDDEVEFMHKIGDRILGIFAARSKEAGEHGTASQPLTKLQFKKRWTRTDWWLSSDEALRYGVVDEVV